jgi:hypothetical protein
MMERTEGTEGKETEEAEEAEGTGSHRETEQQRKNREEKL